MVQPISPPQPSHHLTNWAELSWSRMKIQIKCLYKEGDIDIVLPVTCDGCCECDTF